MTNPSPNHPAVGNAELALQFAIEHHFLGVPQPVRSATGDGFLINNYD